jgi:hypothetical protein
VASNPRGATRPRTKRSFLWSIECCSSCRIQRRWLRGPWEGALGKRYGNQQFGRAGKCHLFVPIRGVTMEWRRSGRERERDEMMQGRGEPLVQQVSKSENIKNKEKKIQKRPRREGLRLVIYAMRQTTNRRRRGKTCKSSSRSVLGILSPLTPLRQRTIIYSMLAIPHIYSSQQHTTAYVCWLNIHGAYNLDLNLSPHYGPRGRPPFTMSIFACIRLLHPFVPCFVLLGQPSNTLKEDSRAAPPRGCRRAQAHQRTVRT